MNPFVVMSEHFHRAKRTAASARLGAPLSLTSRSGSRTQLERRRVRGYRFLAYCIDPEKCELRFADSPIALPPKVFEVIVYLLEHRHRAVGKDELMAAIWGRVDVAHLALAQAMLIARYTLNDTGREPLIIRSVLRFGYQWIAPVEIEYVQMQSANFAVKDDFGAEDASTSCLASRRRIVRWLLMLLLLMTSLVAAFFFNDLGWVIAKN